MATPPILAPAAGAEAALIVVAIGFGIATAGTGRA
jgi:hypothetical protein